MKIYISISLSVIFTFSVSYAQGPPKTPSAPSLPQVSGPPQGAMNTAPRLVHPVGGTDQSGPPRLAQNISGPPAIPLHPVAHPRINRPEIAQTHQAPQIASQPVFPQVIATPPRTPSIASPPSMPLIHSPPPTLPQQGPPPGIRVINGWTEGFEARKMSRRAMGLT